MERERCLATGGAGFLGSHPCARFLQSGNEVLLGDNRFASRQDNVHHLLDYPRLEHRDITLARCALGRTLATALKQGLEKTIDYLRRTLTGVAEQAGQ